MLRALREGRLGRIGINGIIRVPPMTCFPHRTLAHALTPDSRSFLSAEDAEANHVIPVTAHYQQTAMYRPYRWH